MRGAQKPSAAVYQADILATHSIQLIHQRVELPAGRFDLALQRGVDVGHLLRRQGLVEPQHLLDEGDHAVAVGGIRCR